MGVLIVASGTELNKETLLQLVNKNEYIICADGGLNYVEKFNIIPDAILGDFDSVREETLEKYKKLCKDIIQFEKEKDLTDTEIAIDFAVDNGYSNITLICASGTRLDHTFANVMLIEKYNSIGVNIKVIDNNNEIELLKEKIVLKNRKKYFTSIVPITKIVKGITLKGFKYKLIDKDVSRGSTLCISNYIIDDFAEISIKEGTALVFTSKD